MTQINHPPSLASQKSSISSIYSYHQKKADDDEINKLASDLVRHFKEVNEKIFVFGKYISNFLTLINHSPTLASPKRMYSHSNKKADDKINKIACDCVWKVVKHYKEVNEKVYFAGWKNNKFAGWKKKPELFEYIKHVPGSKY